MTATSSTALQLPGIEVTGVVAMGALGELLDGVYTAGPATGTRVAVQRLEHDRPLHDATLRALRRHADQAIGRAHPNLLQTLALVTAAGAAYLVVEALDGLDGARVRMATTTIPEWVVVAIAAQALAGLGRAHASPATNLRGELGPAHLLLCRDGRVKLLDPAIAPRLPAAPDHAFASPEQVRGEPLDERSDLFQLAATLHFLLTGSPGGATPPPRAPIDPRTPESEVATELLRPDMSAALARWLARALARDRTDRYASAAEMLDALTDAVGSPADADQLARWIAALPAPAIGPAPEIAVGTKLGRYVVLHKLGEGGMGVVYTAYDPELDRKIALKLMRPRAAGDGQARLLREAQAMARVAHPNTVAIFDVGLIDGRVFLAMELVAGVTLAEWLRADRRSWREIVAVMCDAGRGLAAAHDAGLAHRDFKPDNVIIGHDGRPKVTDFGLARRALAADDPDLDADAAAPSPATGASLGDSVTHLGAVIGTPAYMAPEQRRGHPPDVRTDQYSFGVTLCQALYGQRPFDVEQAGGPATPADRVSSYEPPPNKQVPRWFAAIVKRALSVRPEDRYPSMHALLGELSRDPGVRLRRALLWTTAVVVVVGVIATVRLGGRDEAAACDVADARLRGVWDHDVKAVVEQAFRATSSAIAVESWERTASILDRYARDWATMYHDACAATRIHKDQSEAVMSLRMMCLDRAQAQLHALTTVLAAADRGIVERSTQAAAGLPRLAECADVPLLARVHGDPGAPVDRDQLAHATTAVARVNALYETGRYADGLAAAEALERELGDALPRITAEAAYLSGQLLFARGQVDQAMAAFESAVIAAERGAYPLYVARAYGRLTFLAACPKADAATADRYARHARAVIAAIGGDPLAETWRLSGSACVRDRANDVDGATADIERALAVYTKAYGVDALYATLLTTLGASLGREPLRALRAIEDAISTQEALLGHHHPKLAFSLIVLAHTLTWLGRYDEATRAIERAIAIREPTVSGPDRLLASAYLAAAAVLRAQHELVRAAAVAQRGLDMRTSLFGEDATDTAEAEIVLAGILVDRGDAAAATPRLEAALARLRAAARDQNDADVAVIDARLALGAAYRAAGRLPEAAAMIERAMAGAQARHDGREIAACQLGLAQVVAEAPRSLDRARELATAARRGFAALPDPVKAREVERWLAAHPQVEPSPTR